MKTIFLLSLLIIAQPGQAQRIGSGTLETIALTFAGDKGQCQGDCGNSDLSEWEEAFDQAQPLNVLRLKDKKSTFHGRTSERFLFMNVMFDFTGPLLMASAVWNQYVDLSSFHVLWREESGTPGEMLRHLNFNLSPIQKYNETREDYRIFINGPKTTEKPKFNVITFRSRGNLIISKIDVCDGNTKEILSTAYAYGKLVKVTN